MRLVQRGRRAFEQRAWEDAYAALAQVALEGPLEPDDLERLAHAALLGGRDDEGLRLLERLHDLRVERGDPSGAARAAFWLGFRANAFGERARGSGWLAKAQRLVDRAGDCVEAGYLRLPEVLRCLAAGDHAGALAAAAEAVAIAERLGDRDLRAFALNFQGRTLIRQGRLAEGLPLLDEAMVAVTSGGLSPIVTGLIYCSAIAGCRHSHALDRAREWTAALSGWCEAQPQLGAFAGTCLVHRSEILQLGGAWPEAVEEARRATTRLSGTKNPEAGDALYQEGELHRLRGDAQTAERLYASASERGRDPQPGLALLRLQQGRADLAAAALRRVLAATPDALQRTRFLPAQVEILLAAGDVAEARRAAEELCGLAEGFGMEILGATALHAKGAVALAEGDARAAIEPLRRAQDVWQRAGAPHAGARTRVLVARAFEVLGDADGAALELDAARKVFLQLGAAPDLAALDTRPAASPSRGAHGLSARELEVLRLVAQGKTNKEIARALFVSERTVDRHVSNIFGKLRVPTRAAATAWAVRQGLAG